MGAPTIKIEKRAGVGGGGGGGGRLGLGYVASTCRQLNKFNN